MTSPLPTALLTGSPWRLRAVAVVFAASCAVALAWLWPGLTRSLEERAGDMLWRVGTDGAAGPAAARAAERRVVVVDIDEASLSRLGPWPWPRERIAELSRQLAQMGAGIQVFDVVFPDPKPGDAALAAEFARQPVVLAQIFSLDPETPAAAGALSGALRPGAPACAAPLAQAFGYIANAPALAEAVTASGHITPRIAADGAVRHLPAVVCFDGRAYPALGLAALLKAAGAEPAWSLEAGSGWLDPHWRLRNPSLPGVGVPLDANGDIRLSYRLPRRAFVSVSAADVLAGKVPAELLRGAWVLVGATAFGIGDAVPTPHGGAVGGVEVHGQFISALLDERLPHTPRAAPLVSLLLGFVAGVVLLFSVLSRRAPALVAPAAGALVAAAAFGLHAWALLGHHLWLGWAAVAGFGVLGGVLLGAAEHARARFERGRLYDNLASYLPAPVAAQIAFREPTGAVDARRREVSVLFADIRNFSAYCEGRPPEEAAAMLHAFFTAAARVVKAEGGLVQEFTGDAVMAVWNGLDDCPDHAARALASALGLHAQADVLFVQPPPPGLAPLALGIGIESGNALVGSIGPVHRRTHAALGETVTVAARLQALTADLAEPILLGEGIAGRLAPEAVKSLGSFLLEGLRRPRLVYAPVSGNLGQTVTRLPRSRVARLRSR